MHVGRKQCLKPELDLYKTWREAFDTKGPRIPLRCRISGQVQRGLLKEVAWPPGREVPHLEDQVKNSKDQQLLQTSPWQSWKSIYKDLAEEEVLTCIASMHACWSPEPFALLPCMLSLNRLPNLSFLDVYIRTLLLESVLESVLSALGKPTFSLGSIISTSPFIS